MNFDHVTPNTDMKPIKRRQTSTLQDRSRTCPSNKTTTSHKAYNPEDIAVQPGRDDIPATPTLIFVVKYLVTDTRPGHVQLPRQGPVRIPVVKPQPQEVARGRCPIP